MTILILSKEDDLHVSAVEWGLKQFGCDTYIWNWHNFPHGDTCKWNLNVNSFSLQDIWVNDRNLGSNITAVWNRRFGVPTPTANSHEDDYELIKKESVSFLRNMLRLIGDSETRWVNPLVPSMEADHKIRQLVFAKQAGFDVPDTYIGNDPAELLNFYNKHHKKIIFKAFNPGGWYKNDGPTTVLKTARVLEEHIHHAEAIRACPAIYQPLIEKEYEIRVTVIGNRVLAGKISADNTCVDWRYDSPQACRNVTFFELPAHIADKCISLSRSMGLEFGCIDLIYSKTGNIIFLEINEAGQFMWKELADPKLNVLDAFCRLLAASEFSDTELQTKPVISLQNYFKTDEYKTTLGNIINASGTKPSNIYEEA
ncbi:hypothetical protein [Undibacterium sp. TS12]|uniref:hypothetical protein n=1 Tax=Undibacterium sp. TS12 TaxID=2908202 RepID=UPI001F4CE4F7|nr:hypothetical protein [Undibacterium sp. TS12]MCH8620462.1 hypothetical protein [Undibacterium sp. TS12]